MGEKVARGAAARSGQPAGNAMPGEGRPPRILHVLDHSIPLHSGYTFRTAAILREQHKLGWETYHLTSPKHSHGQAPEETVDGLHFYRTSCPHWNLTGVDEWVIMQSLTARLYEVTSELRPDVLHAHSPALNAIPALRVGRQLGIPVVYEVRAFWEDAAVDHGTSREWGLRYRLTRGLETHVLRRVDHVTTICNGLRDDILSRGVPGSRVTVIPNAVDADRFALGGTPDAALKEQLGLTGCTVLGFIGSFYAYEGLNVLLNAFPKIREAVPDARILLVGGGFQERYLREQAEGLGITDQVVFSGRVPHEQVGKYYDLVDVLVYPRLSMRLTELVTPLKPLEAMAQGRLLAASDVGGHRELIRDGENAVLFRAGDPQSLADRVTGLLSDTESWPGLRRAARDYIEKERNWPVSVARYREVYGQVVSDEQEVFSD